MCEVNEEIQSEWILKDWDIFAYRYSKGLGMVWEVIGVKDRPLYIKENCIYLPTQEQLQEMVLNHGYHGYDNSGISQHLNLFSIEYGLEGLTFNELWLAFVMKEKYNKFWTGQKWVKAE